MAISKQIAKNSLVLVYSTTDDKGEEKKYRKTIPNLNPSASDEAVKTAGEKLMRMTKMNHKNTMTAVEYDLIEE